MSGVSIYEYSHIVEGGVDHRLIAKLCALSIVNQLAFSPDDRRRGELYADALEAFITTVIFNSKLGFGVAVSAMIFAERYQERHHKKLQFFSANVDDARRIFLVSYMVAARIMFPEDRSFTLALWKKVTEREYDCSDLSDMVANFCQAMGDDIQIHEEEFIDRFKELTSNYQSFVDSHTLPVSPLPTYHPTQPQQMARPRASSDHRDATSEDDLLGRKGVGTMELPLPCTASERLGGYSPSLFGFVRPSHNHQG